MSNPVLSEKIFERSRTENPSGTMTIKGTLNKSILLIIMTVAAAAYTWRVFYYSTDPSSVLPWMYGGIIAGFVVSLIITFRPHLSPYLAPVYSLCEGFALGGISASFNSMFAVSAPNLVINAVLLTFLAAFVMLFVFRARIIKVTGTFTRVIVIAMGAIALFYIIQLVLSMFGVQVVGFGTSLGIGINLVVVGVASFSLLTDYKMIEDLALQGAPKYMEWYGAFGLMVTLVWLYLEMLRLLAQFASNRE